MNTLNNYEVFADVMKGEKRIYRTSSRVVASCEADAAKKIESRGDHKVTKVIYVSRFG